MNDFCNNSTPAGETIQSSNEALLGKQIFIPGLWAVFWLTGVEYLVLWMQKKALPSAHENILSLLHGSFFVLAKIFLHTFEYNAYLWMLTSYGVFQGYFSESVLSFLASLLLIDFCYYWFHRAGHEITLLWAIHQVHHSSYDLTFTVGLRHSPFKLLFSWAFFLPLAAVGFPPAHIMFHIELSYLVQVFTHTCTVSTLGPLEWFLNTPSHHRVHHGSNRRCLDKNYGGIFIIWDKIFGTFRREDPEQKILYGIVMQPDFWNIFQHQIFYLMRSFRKSLEMANWKNSLEALIKGPSWLPGLSWTGKEGRDPDFDEKLDWNRVKANASFAVNTYTFVHSIIVMYLVSCVAESKKNGNIGEAACQSIFILSCFLNLSILYEGKTVAPILELFRCFVGLLLHFSGSFISSQTHIVAFIYFGSILVWLVPKKIRDNTLGLKVQLDVSEEKKLD